MHAVLLLTTQALSQELNSTLHSTFYDVQVAYVDEMVTFTCVIKGSNSMAWTSDEYIGVRDSLEISTSDSAGHTITALTNDQTVAMLVAATRDEVIISKLRIRIKSDYPVASVQCVNANRNTMTSISFRLAGII